MKLPHYSKFGDSIWDRPYIPRSLGDRKILDARLANYAGDNAYPDRHPYNLTHRPPKVTSPFWGGSTALTCVNY